MGYPTKPPEPPVRPKNLETEHKTKLLENLPLLLNDTDRACILTKDFLIGDNPASDLTRANEDPLKCPKPS